MKMIPKLSGACGVVRSKVNISNIYTLISISMHDFIPL